jgi:hypothetical protein
MERSCFSSPNLQQLKIGNRFLWDRNVCIVFDACSPILPTGISEIKRLSIDLIRLRFGMFGISPLNPSAQKRSDSCDKKSTLIGTFHTCPPNSSHPVMEIKILRPGNYLRYPIVFIRK